jgi:hypothetical protein
MTQKSAATLRASNYTKDGGEWYCGFAYTPAKGLGPEEGIHRRDPSSVLLVDGVYYVYYTRSAGPAFGRSQMGHPSCKLFPWDYADIFYATSKDGTNWEEQGPAVSRGPSGAFDARTVCTPDAMMHDGKFYLVYQTQAEETQYSGRSENVGMAIADNPNGPWRKVEKSILEPMDDGIWFDDEDDSYNTGMFAGVTHDPMLLHYNGEWCLYYKCGYGYDGENRSKGHKHSGPDTRWGVATSKTPEGPYVHSPFNPVTNSGHETMLWHYNGGIAALLNRDGPEQDTIQWSPDGVNFEIMAHVHNTPQAPGPLRSGREEAHPLEGMRWGLCHTDERGAAWNYITRFDIDPRHSYRFGSTYAENNSGITT